MTLARSVFCNPWGVIGFTIYSSFVSRANIDVVFWAGGDDSLLFFRKFFPPNDFCSVAPAYAPKKEIDNVSCYHTLPSFPLELKVPHEMKVSNHSTMFIEQQQQQQQQQRTDKSTVQETCNTTVLYYKHSREVSFYGF